MWKINIGGTVDPLERMLLRLTEDWDELERWAVRYSSNAETIRVATEGKEKMLAAIRALREEH